MTLLVGLCVGLLLGLLAGGLLGWLLAWPRAVAAAQVRAAAAEDARLSTAAQADLQALLAPVQASLSGLDASVRELELARASAYGGLLAEVRELGRSSERLTRETGVLASALRPPRSRGRWGEVTLRRVLELSGMLEHCDFSEQVSVRSPDGAGRPDVLVHLPGGAGLVIDAKAPLDAWLEACEQEAGGPPRRDGAAEASDAPLSDARLAAARRAHARALRAHIDALAARGYPRLVPGALDLVVLFVPGEDVLAAALQADPALFDHAARKRVVLACPPTLIALLAGAAAGWRQAAVADNADRIAELGAELHARLGSALDKASKLGRALEGSVRAYNDLIGSIEGRVLVSARRLADLAELGSALPAPEPVDLTVRPRRGDPSAA